jgi:hypothetical protein
MILKMTQLKIVTYFGAPVQASSGETARRLSSPVDKTSTLIGAARHMRAESSAELCVDAVSPLLLLLCACFIR